jgi:acyl-coenzyme A synthetase/AMP-(fatty) acid ligase
LGRGGGSGRGARSRNAGGRGRSDRVLPRPASIPRTATGKIQRLNVAAALGGAPQ